MTPRQLITEKRCSHGCLTATTTTQRCECPCRGAYHSLVTDADVTALADSRVAGLHRMTDAEVIARVA